MFNLMLVGRCYNGFDILKPEANNKQRVIRCSKKHAASRGFLAAARLLFILAMYLRFCVLTFHFSTNQRICIIKN